VDEKSLNILEFPKIKQILASFTSFSASRELAINLQPLSEYQTVMHSLQQSAEARQLLSREPGFSIGGVVDIRPEVRLAAHGKVLDPQVLLQVGQTLAAARQLHRSLAELSGELPQLWQIASAITGLPSLEKNISNCLLPNGELADSASPRLANIRQQLKTQRQQLHHRLEAIIRSPRGQRALQEPTITERQGRYVIPVKIDYRREIKGIVHDISNTGATVFVEPWSLVELGNQIRELAIAEEQEIDRILGELSHKVGSHQTAIDRNIALIAELDLALAKARYAHQIEATEPTIISDHDSKQQPAVTAMKLVDARHPLLPGTAVPLTVEMGRDFSVLVITGPNTGGKTVALKTMGLLSLMAQSGMPIPASPESRIPLFDGIFADIGDEQSIEQTLSTFSWHMGNIIRIINQATARSLVLLDELGTSTDPAEGSALARSILLHFQSQGAMTVATTHYGDLKAFAHATAGLQNASLDFNPVTLSPTYHLTVGIPGGSNALATAARLGLPEAIISDARQMISSGSQELETLLASLLDEKQRVTALRQEWTKQRDEADRLGTELTSELERVRREEQGIIQQTRDQVVAEATALHREIRHAVAQLKRQTSRERVDQARKTLAAIRGKLDGDAWQSQVSSQETGIAGAEAPITAGDSVRLKEANVEAIVLSVITETREAEVQAGPAKIRLSLDSLEKVTPAAVVPGRPPTELPISRKQVPTALDLRGKRADEVEATVDSYLNDASLAGLPQVRIIHGIGTGTVRLIVRDLLEHHPLVQSFRPGRRGEGGNGATMVTL